MKSRADETLLAMGTEWRTTGQIATTLGITTAAAYERLRKLARNKRVERAQAETGKPGRPQWQWRHAAGSEG